MTHDHRCNAIALLGNARLLEVPPSRALPANKVGNPINAQLEIKSLNRSYPTIAKDLTSHSAKRSVAHLRKKLMRNSQNYPKKPYAPPLFLRKKTCPPAQIVNKTGDFTHSPTEPP